MNIPRCVSKASAAIPSSACNTSLRGVSRSGIARLLFTIVASRFAWRHLWITDFIMVVGDERVEGFLNEGWEAALGNQRNPFEYHIHRNQPFFRAPLQLHRYRLEDQVGQQNTVKGGQQRHRHAGPDHLQSTGIHHFQHIDQSYQGADHAEGRRIVGHGAEDLRFGIFARLEPCYTPTQQVKDLFLLGVGDHQLNAGTQEGIARFLQCRFDGTYIALEPQSRHIDEFLDIVVGIGILTTKHQAYQPYHPHHFLERIADECGGHGTCQHNGETRQVDEALWRLGSHKQHADQQHNTGEHADECGWVHSGSWSFPDSGIGVTRTDFNTIGTLCCLESLDLDRRFVACDKT